MICGVRRPGTCDEPVSQRNTIMKIAGWKTPNMFRRYDIQDGRDIRQAAEIMEKRLS